MYTYMYTLWGQCMHALHACRHGRLPMFVYGISRNQARPRLFNYLLQCQVTILVISGMSA